MSSGHSAIENRLTLFVLTFSVLFGLMFSLVQIYWDHQSQEEAFLRHLSNLVQHQGPVLALLDDQDAQSIAEQFTTGLLMHPAIIAIRIENERGGLLLHRGRKNSVPEDFLRLTETVRGESGGGSPGEKYLVEVVLNQEMLHSDVLEQALYTSIVEVLRNLALAAVLIWLVRTRITRPIQRLADHINSIDPELPSGERVSTDSRVQEFEDLAGKINGLLKAVDQQMQRRSQAEQEVRQLNEQLEEKVRDRTRELNDTNSQLQTSLNELQRTQGLLLQTQRMAAMGHLAAGIAHEINNPVAVVYSNIATMSEYLSELLELTDRYQDAESSILDVGVRRALSLMRQEMDLTFVKEDAPQIIENSKRSLERVRAIVSELRTFAGNEEQSKDLVDLKDTMTLVLAELDLHNHPHIRLDLYMEALPKIQGVRSQVRLVFFNLLKNARDAIEGAGRIEIAAEATDSGLKVVVKDSGSGMGHEDMEAAINPFFSGKASGERLGLGLTVAYNIMMNHGGSLTIDSEKHIGTSVSLLFPLDV